MTNIYLLRRKRQIPRLYLVYTVTLLITTTIYWGAAVSLSTTVLIIEPTNPQDLPSNFENVGILADVMPVLNFWIVGIMMVRSRLQTVAVQPFDNQ